MDRFSAIVTRMDDAIWSMLLVALCLGVGLFLSLRMRFPQLRLLKEMGRVLKNGEEDGNGITPFQAFATTVGRWRRHIKCAMPVVSLSAVRHIT